VVGVVPVARVAGVAQEAPSAATLKRARVTSSTTVRRSMR
jgi:hypothetical protein